MIKLTAELAAHLRAKGVESFHAPGIRLPDDAIFEPPCGIKWIGMVGPFRMGAFSYAVSGHLARVTIGRYCSIGEQVQIGRPDHLLTGVSTSPFFLAQEALLAVGNDFAGAPAYHSYKAPRRNFAFRAPSVVLIGNDVWIGHGAYIRPGVTVGDGAVIGAMSVVTKDVPPYAIVAGNPATVRRERLSPVLAAQMLDVGWWRFAPWQLSEVDFTRPESAIDRLREIADSMAPYTPATVRLKDVAA